MTKRTAEQWSGKRVLNQFRVHTNVPPYKYNTGNGQNHVERIVNLSCIAENEHEYKNKQY